MVVALLTAVREFHIDHNPGVKSLAGLASLRWASCAPDYGARCHHQAMLIVSKINKSLATQLQIRRTTLAGWNIDLRAR